MRISFTMQKNQTLLTLNDKLEQINHLSQSISSGTKLSSPSDDPNAWAQSMNVNQGLREYNSILSNITFATGWGQTTSSTLNQLSNLVSQAKQTAISAVSATGIDQSAALVTQTKGILQQAVNLANSQYGDQYIFGGTATAAAPFSLDSSTGAVTYSGNSGYINVRTSSGNDSVGGSAAVNLTGNDIFSYTSGGSTLNVFQEIQGLAQAIQSGDTATINSKITTLDDAFNHINDESAISGATLSEFTAQQSAISVCQTNGKSILSSLQDTDIATATIQLQQAQTSFQAALQVTSMLGNLNLASYLSSGSSA